MLRSNKQVHCHGDVRCLTGDCPGQDIRYSPRDSLPNYLGNQPRHAASVGTDFLRVRGRLFDYLLRKTT